MMPARASPRAVAICARYGHDVVAPQGLGRTFHHWFDGDDGLVAFVDTGAAWVAAGSPIAPVERLAETARRFVEAARAVNRRACFFGAERPLVDAGLPALAIGEQPVWTAARWPDVLASHASLRYQVKRARNRGLVVRPALPADRATIAAIAADWQTLHRMPPMHFIVELDPVAIARTRHVLVAEKAGALVGFTALVPIPARDRVFVEHLVRLPDAPNGTPELLIDAAMRAGLGAEVTLGLAPLSGAVPWWLRVARRLGNPLYDFAGLRAFKDKLQPHAWEPVYLCAAPDRSRLIALHDSLRAFAGGSLLAFGGRTVQRLLRE